MLKNSKILGVKISNVNSYRKVYEIIKTRINSRSSYITVNNVHTVVEGAVDGKFKKIINGSFLALPDGKPLSIVAKLKGGKNIDRIFGPTLFEKTLDWGQKDGIKHYFFGSSNETLEQMINTIRIKFPQAIISGCFSPPFKKFTGDENEVYLNQMNASGAELFWIGLGAPKQEIWMHENHKKLNKGIMIGIGAGFDYLAGNTKHAPEWMKKTALEWLYRLIQEPKRLWKRYLVANSLFIFLVILESLNIKKFKEID
jgi:N-acetylglucosaminyldiphosphoundecaprenol N-acetyl-beta-D-mannosaminyltransferase